MDKTAITAVIDYGMGNLNSVEKALERAGADVLVTGKARDLERASRLVLPGVGSFAQAMQHLSKLNLINVLNEQVIVKKKPFLGICLGMQLAAKRGYEGGEQKGLGWIDAKVIALVPRSQDFKVPHIGWNDVEFAEDSLLFKKLKSPAAFYFVHGYHFVPDDPGIATALCDHGGKFVASVSIGNIHLVQFHPEKSQRNGLQILENFLCS